MGCGASGLKDTKSATETPSASEGNANLSETIAPPAAATTTEATVNNVDVEGSPKTAEVNETDANQVNSKDDNQHEGIDNQAVNDGDNKVKTVAPVSISGDADVVNSSADEPKVNNVLLNNSKPVEYCSPCQPFYSDSNSHKHRRSSSSNSSTDNKSKHDCLLHCQIDDYPLTTIDGHIDDLSPQSTPTNITMTTTEINNTEMLTGGSQLDIEKSTNKQTKMNHHDSVYLEINENNLLLSPSALNSNNNDYYYSEEIVHRIRTESETQNSNNPLNSAGGFEVSALDLTTTTTTTIDTLKQLDTKYSPRLFESNELSIKQTNDNNELEELIIEENFNE
ncbi:unnamed protein product [Trichobilharzia szidati]|nr:unnamed protein product [Trichobilharzia szidati]